MTAMFNEEMKLEEERRVSDMRRSVSAVRLPVAGAFRPVTPRRDNGGGGAAAASPQATPDRARRQPPAAEGNGGGAAATPRPSRAAGPIRRLSFS